MWQEGLIAVEIKVFKIRLSKDMNQKNRMNDTKL